VGHSKLSSVGRRNMSLLEAAREHVALAIRQQLDLQRFTDGLAAGGRGKAAMQRRSDMYKADLKRAAAYGEELQQNILPLRRQATFIPMVGLHRPQDAEEDSHSDVPKRQRTKFSKKAFFLRRQSVTAHGVSHMYLLY
jgi:hypothetical protein